MRIADKEYLYDPSIIVLLFLFPHLSASVHNELCARQFGKSHRSTCVEFLRADSDFGA